MAIWWPQVRSRLVSVLPTLPGWSDVAIFDGEPVTADAPLVYCTVGFVDGEDSAGTFDKVHDDLDGALRENGTVRCELVLATGDVDLPGLEAQGFALLSAFEDWLRTHPFLSLPDQSASAFYSADVVQYQTSSGSVIRLPWTLTYSTVS